MGAAPPGSEPAAAEPARTLDVRGLACPIPVARTAQAAAGLGSGELLEVLATDPDAELDVRAWAVRSGNEVLSVERDGEVQRLLVRRA
jgi:tRNA 2-thiouridine synthesizing protein A